MKTLSLDANGLTLERLLQEATGEEVVFLTERGQVRFALVPADDGDEEVRAMQSNADLMEYLARCAERARQGPRKSMRQIREQFGLPSGSPQTSSD